jgi:hypothetical protein
MEKRHAHFQKFKESTMPNIPIQTVACTIRPESALRALSLVQLAFPVEWFEPLQGLQAERNSRPDQPNTIAIWSLNAVLHALVPHLLAAPYAAQRREEPQNEEEPDRPSRGRPPWLLAEHVIPVEKLWNIVQAWLEQTYSECESFPTVKTLLRREDLQWEPVTLSLLEKTCENGTADIPPLAYKVIPAFLADMLAKIKVSLQVGSLKRPLVRVPVEEGAELMTWPPVYTRRGKDKEKRFGYSYVVKITLQTIVGHPEPRVHFHYSVRRWQSEPCFDGTKLYLKRRTSVYLRPSKAWYELPQTAEPRAFTVAKIEAVKTGGEGQRTPVWMNLVTQIAKRVNVSIPSADQLTRKPIDWLEGLHNVEAGIVYTNPRKHPVGTGIGPDICEKITAELLAALSSELALCPPCKPYPIPSKVTAHPLIEDLREMTAEARLTALVESVGPQVTIEVRWKTEAVRDMLADRIVALLTGPRPPLIDPPPDEAPPEEAEQQPFEGEDMLDEDEDEEFAFAEESLEDGITEEENAPGAEALPRKPRRARRRAPDPPPETFEKEYIIPFPGGGQLRIVPLALEDLDAPLPAPNKQKKETMHTHTNERAKKITEQVEPARTPTLTFIELPDYRRPDLRQRFGRRDPKRALRLGMARTGRVTHFITNEEKGLRERCGSAVRDGLRQLGYLPYPIGFSMPRQTLPESLLVVGVWFVRITRRRAAVGVHLPVVIMLHTEQRKVFAWLPHDGRIRPYRQALLDIVKLDPEQVRKRKRQDALNQVRQFLLGDVTRQGADEIVAFTVAQNARSTWHGLYNSEAPFDALRFERRERVLEAKDLPVRFRLIHLRTNLRGETPEWYVPGSMPATTTQGLWVEQDADEKTTRLFYSIAAKPHTAPKNYVGKQSKPRENYRLSSIVEIVPLIIHEADQPGTWAVAVDQWRKMGFLTSDMTLLPLPLEFARKMDEYAEVIGPWIFPNEWNDDAEDDEIEGESEDLVE